MPSSPWCLPPDHSRFRFAEHPVPPEQKVHRMKPGLRKSAAARVLAAGLLVPLLGTATACTASDPDPQGTPKVAATSSPSTSPAKPKAGASSSPASDQAPPAASEEQDGAGQSPQPAPVPTFNETEQRFLEGKVPEGMDPNAVLQVGQERCELLLTAKSADPEAVISELITSPSAETSEAITVLCTDLLPELEAAALGFPDGEFAVAEAAPQAEKPSIAAGTYRPYTVTEGCTISVFTASGATIGEYDGTVPVTIGADAARVESSQCYSWLRV